MTDLGPWRLMNKPGRWYAVPGEAGQLKAALDVLQFGCGLIANGRADPANGSLLSPYTLYKRLNRMLRDSPGSLADRDDQIINRFSADLLGDLVDAGYAASIPRVVQDAEADVFGNFYFQL